MLEFRLRPSERLQRVACNLYGANHLRRLKACESLQLPTSIFRSTASFRSVICPCPRGRGQRPAERSAGGGCRGAGRRACRSLRPRGARGCRRPGGAAGACLGSGRGGRGADCRGGQVVAVEVGGAVVEAHPVALAGQVEVHGRRAGQRGVVQRLQDGVPEAPRGAHLVRAEERVAPAQDRVRQQRRVRVRRAAQPGTARARHLRHARPRMPGRGGGGPATAPPSSAAAAAAAAAPPAVTQ